MDLLQSWLIVGVPALLITAGLFVGRSAPRALLGYAVLVATVVFFLTVPRDTISAAAIGLVGFLLVANGRGTNVDEQFPEHHENRKRYTTTPSSP